MADRLRVAVFLSVHRKTTARVSFHRTEFLHWCAQAVREQSEDLRLLRSAVNEAKAAMQRRQQEEDQRLLKVLLSSPRIS